MDEGVCLPKIVEELVAKTPPFMRLRDETGDIKQLDGDEPRAAFARRVLRLARMTQLFVRTSLPNEGHPAVRLDCGERIVCDLDRRERRRGEEGGLANVRFPDRKSTRLNSSHRTISYAVFCL